MRQVLCFLIIGVSTTVFALPLGWVQGFVENRGQWDVPFVYVYAKPTLTVGVLPTGLVFDVYEQRAEILPHGRLELPQKRVHRRGHVIWLTLEGAAPSMARTQASETAFLHFLRGRDPSRWHGFIPIARVIELPELYPGIALRLWGLPEGPRYDFILQPGADPSRIRLRITGAEGISLAADGTEVRFFGAQGPILFHANLRAYQEIGGRLISVPVGFRVEGSESGSYRLGFALGDYNPRYPLIIDPVVYTTCIGSGADERAPSLTRLPDGSILTVVQAEELTFRMTPGAYDTTYNGLTDAVVLRLDAALQRLLFATYLGGKWLRIPHCGWGRSWGRNPGRWFDELSGLPDPECLPAAAARRGRFVCNSALSAGSHTTVVHLCGGGAATTLRQQVLSAGMALSSLQDALSRLTIPQLQRRTNGRTVGIGMSS